MQVRHCALSLVGEPIMYPEINRLIALLHARRISSFLVTNAQFPDRIRQALLCPSVQLRVHNTFTMVISPKLWRCSDPSGHHTLLNYHVQAPFLRPCMHVSAVDSSFRRLLSQL